MKLAPLADSIVKELSHKPSWSEIWDMCDLKSGGELDTTQMDILTEMVCKRLDKIEAEKIH